VGMKTSPWTDLRAFRVLRGLFIMKGLLRRRVSSSEESEWGEA
jgi:hypothetical protein